MSEKREQFSTPLEIDIDLMNQHIKCLVFSIDQEMIQLQKRSSQLTVTKIELQNVCDHKFKPDGQTHGGHYEICTICGFTQRQ